MYFNNLADKCNYYRDLADYKLLPNSYVLCMLDGRSFSKMIKNSFKKPFDAEFMRMMDETAKYVCKNVQGAKFAYVQSDEISIVLTDFETPTTDSFFSYRLCKMQSIIASLATAKFNQLMLCNNFERMFDEYGNNPSFTSIEVASMIDNMRMCQFDCKCWNVPNVNDVYAWFLHRQIDCIRNSKQQAAQSYLTHKELVNKNTDQQVELLLTEKGVDWNGYKDGEKYGRFIWKQLTTFNNIDTGTTYKRHEWQTHEAFVLTGETGRKSFFDLEVIPEPGKDYGCN
jgi:tRNA(His) 5'-end guanylyltransferase